MLFLEDFENADFAYAPPFSTAIHPFVQAVHVLLNKINGALVKHYSAEYAAGKAKGYKVIDAGLAPSIHGARYVDLSAVQGEIEGLDKEEKLLLVCAKKENVPISCRTVCVSMDIKILWFWKGQTFFNATRKSEKIQKGPYHWKKRNG